MASEGGKSEGAVAAWRKLLGPDRVAVVPPELASSWPSTAPDAHGPSGAVRIRSKEEVVEAVKVAAEFDMPLYPVSRGRNWGYGDALPAGPGQFVLDLSGMDRILEVDDELAFAVVEPGVSQRQLRAHLAEHGERLWAPCTASSPEASLVGNLIERGIGTTTNGNQADNACGLEVVLADGTLVQTGLDRYPKADGHVYRWGLGPSLDGLFLQSNLGVVVRAGIWLMPRPEAFAAFTLTLHDDAHLEPLVDLLRELRLAGVLHSPVTIDGAARSLANRGRYPGPEADRPRPLLPEAAHELLRRDAAAWSDGRWNAIGSFYGTHAQVRAGIADAKGALARLGRFEVLSPLRLRRIERRARPFATLGFRRARRRVAGVLPMHRALAPLQGTPVRGSLDVCRWGLSEVRQGHCEDPVAEGCGLYLVEPVCPANGGEVRRCVQLLEQTMVEHELDPLVQLSVAEARTVRAGALLAFDRSDADATRRAADCHRQLVAKLIDEGFPPARVGVTAMGLLDPAGASYWELVGSLKQALDARRVLAPGRYEPRG